MLAQQGANAVLKKTMKLPCHDILHALQVQEAALMGAWAMQLPMTIRTIVGEDNSINIECDLEIDEADEAAFNTAQAEFVDIFAKQAAEREREHATMQ